MNETVKILIFAGIALFFVLPSVRGLISLTVAFLILLGAIFFLRHIGVIKKGESVFAAFKRFLNS